MGITKFSGRWFSATVVIGACLVAPYVLAADSPAATSEPKPDLLYHNYCSVCHGDRGDGNSRAKGSLNPAPKDFTKLTFPRDYMIKIVAEGKPGTAMVGWKSQLSEKEIEAVVDYIRNTFMQAGSDPRLARGRNVYQQTCVACHGDRGQGVAAAQAGMPRPPRNFTSPQAKLELSRERMIAAVTHGRPGTAMAAFGKQLPKEDIEAVVDFVRSAFMNVTSDGGISGTSAHTGRQGSAAPSQADMKLGYPKGLAGRAEKGEKFYMDNCATCHGKKGDGQGPRAYFINPKPRNFIEPASRSYLNRPAIYSAVSLGSLGTEMPAWKFVMTEQEMADVSEFVFRRFIVQESGKTARAQK